MLALALVRSALLFQLGFLFFLMQELAGAGTHFDVKVRRDLRAGVEKGLVLVRAIRVPDLGVLVRGRSLARPSTANTRIARTAITQHFSFMALLLPLRAEITRRV